MKKFVLNLLLEHLLFLVAITGISIWFASTLNDNPIQRVSLSLAPTAEAKTTTESAVLPITEPTRLVIPKIGVSAKIVPVGLTPSGAMAVPPNFTDVAWFRLGVKPGEKGQAVMNGHLDTGWNSKGVFQNLYQLEPGDVISILDQNKRTLNFKVIRSQLYDASDAPVEKIFGMSNEVLLNLITCDGVWNSDARAYDRRLVVFAKFDSIGVASSTPAIN